MYALHIVKLIRKLLRIRISSILSFPFEIIKILAFHFNVFPCISYAVSSGLCYDDDDDCFSLLFAKNAHNTFVCQWQWPTWNRMGSKRH